jgi:hypothetical protein
VKNQYYGDINDYRKYGILRSFALVGPLSIGICWMLTPDDGRGDGSKTAYLQNPVRWRQYDPPLFDQLVNDVLTRRQRDVTCAERSQLVPGATYHGITIPDDKQARSAILAEALERLFTCELVFFDPDNGIEVASVACGAKNSSKYVYWQELTAAYAEGHSLLVYQHYPREKRSVFHDRIGREMSRKLPGATLYALTTSHVVFFLAVRPAHLAQVRQALVRIDAKWGGQVGQELLLSA